MKQLINELVKEVLQQTKPLCTSIIRIESFDNPNIYMSICDELRNNRQIDVFIPKLTKGKYIEFKNANNPSWELSINALMQGANPHFSSNPSQEYCELSYVDTNNAITKWRNKSASMRSDNTSLILLMGTEVAPDTGGLLDTSYVISPQEISNKLAKDYSKWFDIILERNEISSQDCKDAIHTLYKTIFSNINIDIFKFSYFIDQIIDTNFDSAQEIISYICETLSVYWNIPNVIDIKLVPKVQNLSKRTLSSAKIIDDAIKFISRFDDIPTISELKKLETKFIKYAEENSIDVNSGFPAERMVFPNYQAFKQCVIDFKCGKDLDQNREKLLSIDYAIISKIIGTKLPKGTSEKITRITGEPVKAYAEMFLNILDRFHTQNNAFPTQFTVRVNSISLSDCTNEQKDESFMRVCLFMGGILNFFNDENIEIEGLPLTFSYDDKHDNDPFDYMNRGLGLVIKGTGKWGEPCKVDFSITALNDSDSYTCDYKWIFSPYSPWLNAFSYIQDVFAINEDVYVLPTMVICQNIIDFINCESEDDFYSQLSQIQTNVLYQEHRDEMRKVFVETDTIAQFDNICTSFKDFSLQLFEHGLFAALDSLRKVVDAYTKLMDNIRNNYLFGKFNQNQIAKLPLLVNCFTITSNANIINDCDIADVILPAYNPIMLEKIDAKQLFLREGFAELLTFKKISDANDKIIKTKLDNLVQLSSITQGADVLYRKATIYIICQNMWEYYGVYYSIDSTNEITSGNSLGVSVIDDEDTSSMLQSSPMSGIIVKNTLDYSRTFPSSADGLCIAFISPFDMQHIVAAIHELVKKFDEQNIKATINLKIVCINSRKNSVTYLRKWLDSYFSDEQAVKVNTFLCNVNVNTRTDVDKLNNLINNYDLCFCYNIMQSVGVEFHPTQEDSIDINLARFPMTLVPDAIPTEITKMRKTNISQFQFIASKSHTQTSYKIGYPHSEAGVYRAYKSLEISSIQERIIELSHQCCKWVVCTDTALDRKMLETSGSKVIGFTTGEGNYGELNVTVSARNDTLYDVKRMLSNRITDKFKSWDSDKLSAASNYCIDVLSQYIDGSRILKALNPYDYEIHSFLANLLTLQILNLMHKSDEHIVRVLINLDSHMHWFDEDGVLFADNTRPDFMLIEIPKIENNLGHSSKLRIDIKIIECKMGRRNDDHIVKAIEQLEKGLCAMSINWNPHSTSIMHRYWMNQLYRAIIFSPINVNESTVEYNTVRNKIYDVLNGNFEIQWTGDIYAFWLDEAGEILSEQSIDTNLHMELERNGVILNSMVCHEYGQMFIQKMMLPPSERTVNLQYNNITEEIIIPDGEYYEGTTDDNHTDEMIINQEKVEKEFPANETISSSRTNDSEAIKTEQISGKNNIENFQPTNTDNILHSSVQKTLDSVRLLLGEDGRNDKYYWEFGNKELNNRHLLINGNSGCGKTYCIQALLMEAALQGVSSIVFDYTGGFTSSKLDPVFKNTLESRINQRVVRIQKIPINPFVKHEIQIDDDLFVPEDDVDIASKISEILSTVYSLGDQQKSAVYSAVLSGIKKHGELMNFSFIKEELEEIGSSYAKTVISKIQAFTDINPFISDEQFDWCDIRDSSGMVYVIQLTGYSRDIQILLTELLLWDIWSISVKTGSESKPIILVLDEAQNLSHGEKSPSAKILTEGRKFGISGWYATQFMKPQLSDDEIQRLQQAGQKLYFCPPDDGVMTVAKNIDITSQGSKDWAERLKKLKKGECVTCGNMIRNNRFSKYEPRTIKITSLQERIKND